MRSIASTADRFCVRCCGFHSVARTVCWPRASSVHWRGRIDCFGDFRTIRYGSASCRVLILMNCWGGLEASTGAGACCQDSSRAMVSRVHLQNCAAAWRTLALRNMRPGLRHISYAGNLPALRERNSRHPMSGLAELQARLENGRLSVESRKR